MVFVIARFLRAFYYFWVFGIISVLLDLDHIIKIYQDGMALNIENIANLGTRPLHIPILIISGCVCLVTAALFLRFLYLNPNSKLKDYPQAYHQSTSIPIYTCKPYANLLANLLTATVLIESSPTNEQYEDEMMLIECPKCNEQMGVLATNRYSEFPCPYCGVKGYIEMS